MWTVGLYLYNGVFGQMARDADTREKPAETPAKAPAAKRAK